VGEKRLVGTRVAVTGCNGAARRADVVEYFLSAEREWKIPDWYRPVVDVIFGQLLGLFSFLQLGLKPDMPSPNGVIDRVVQTIEIYERA
jgi:tagatose-6-phosphate ketose/aldose isomerase